MRILGTLLFSIGLFSIVSAQQTPEISHYLVNPYLINPSTAGLNGSNASLIIRKQWQGFNGAPETQILTVDGDINRKKMGLGFTVINDNTNIIGKTASYLTYVYNLSITSKQKLRFGISPGIVQNRIIYDNIIAEDEDEIQLFSNNQNAMNFDFNGGIHYMFNDLQIGFAVSHLFAPSFTYENNFTSDSLSFSSIPHFLVNANYNFLLKGGKWEIRPSVLIKSAQGLPFVFEGAVSGYYKKKVWGILRYQNNIGYSAMAGGLVTSQLKLGYSYGLSSNELATQNSGTHEVFIGYVFSKENGGDGSNRDLKDLAEQNAELFEKTDALIHENEIIKEELEKQKTLLKEKIYGLEELKKALEQERLDREKMISEFEFKPSNSSNVESQNPKESETIEEPEQSSPSAEDQEPKEPKQYEVNEDSSDKIVEGDLYVVVGATRKIKEAQDFQKILTREYKLKTRIVRNSRGSWFLIYTLETNDQKEANKELKRVKNVNTKDIYFGKPWIYQD